MSTEANTDEMPPDRSEQPRVKRVPINDWSLLQRTLEAMAGTFIFRGQQRDWPLASSLERTGSVAQGGDEIRLLERFQRSAGVYLPAHLTRSNKLEWLALMQHYGAPTRLLDFTSSPYVALFFAFEGRNWSNEERSIYAVNNAGLVMNAAQAIGARDQASYWPIVTEIQENPGATFERVSNGNPALAVWPFTPSLLDERQTIQQTRLLVPGAIHVPFEQNFTDRLTNENYVRQYIIPDSMRAEIMSDLAAMNVTAASLFPGLDGFGRSMHSYVSLEDYNTMKKRREQRLEAIRKIVDIPDASAVEEAADGAAPPLPGNGKTT